jgi:HEPN domain-containing protein
MVDTLRYTEWLDNAKRDINAAKILLEHECGNDLVAFHCQQAVEKTMKAYLIMKGKGILNTHSLIYLCKMCQEYESNFKGYLKDCALLNQYYIETRYPADDPIHIEDYEINECLKIASEIYETINGLIK